MNRNKAKEELKKLKQKEVELLEIINSSQSLFDNVKEVKDVYDELNENEPTEADFDFLPKEIRKKLLAYTHFKNIERLFNGDWKPNWKNTSEYKYYPWFKNENSGLVFGSSYCDLWGFVGSVAYFKDEQTSNYVGKTFINLYKEIN